MATSNIKELINRLEGLCRGAADIDDEGFYWFGEAYFQAQEYDEEEAKYLAALDPVTMLHVLFVLRAALDEIERLSGPEAPVLCDVDEKTAEWESAKSQTKQARN